MNKGMVTTIKRQLKSNGTKVMATSKAVAHGFEKQHKNVIRDIEALEIPAEFNRLNFEPVNYLDAKGETRRMYSMTRDGFTLLVMGYKGKKAMAIKLAYLEAFNQMERELFRRQAAPKTTPTISIPVSELLELQRFKIKTLEADRKKKPAQRLLTPEEKTRILSLAAAGIGAHAIGTRINRPKSTVRGFLARHKKGVC